MAIISDLKEFEATILHEDLNRCRSSVDRVLNQLFQRMHRSDDDLAGGDFVDNIGIQGLRLLVSMRLQRQDR